MTLLNAILAALLALALTACGGGDPEPDTPTPNNPCSERPLDCK